MTTQLTPVTNLPSLYVNKLPFAWGSNTTLTIGVGQCRDSLNVIDMNVAATLTINAAVNGANGLDTGSLAASTWYYAFVIGDSTAYNAPAALVSLSATAPTLPFGYDSFRLIGAMRTDGSSHFLKFWQAASSGSMRTLFYDVNQLVNATLTSNSLATISVAVGVPPLAATMAWFNLAYTANSAANTVSFRITGSAATTPLFSLANPVAAQPMGAQVKLLTEVSSSNASIDYILSSGSDNLSLSVQGFELAL